MTSPAHPAASPSPAASPAGSPAPSPTPGPAPSPTPEAWKQQELASPHTRTDKQEKVRRMFAAIAQSYDLNNRLHSFWQDQAWRRFAVRQAALIGGETVVDVACGTGDLSIAFARARKAPARVIGIDYTREMLDVAERRRQAQLRAARGSDVERSICYIEGDAQHLPLADATADVVSIAFGIRNVQEPKAALREFYRILRPGGRLVILEFDTPRLPVVKQLSTWYTNWLMPRTATLIAGDTSGAYKYLPASVATFMNAEQLSAAMTEVGFTDCRRIPLTLGVCICHIGHKR